ncbi:MAG: hypothetical protein HC921_20845 [Synechococcaceae cyanobacterium SM2_3_1]|nr:hypothetical protein [Synechococcaceae cyanobacterium SM2_3_1]
MAPVTLLSNTRALNTDNYWIAWRDPELGYIAASRSGVPVIVPNYPPDSGSSLQSSSPEDCEDDIDFGEPHFITFDNLTYDFQAVGEFILAKSSATSFEVQTRQTAMPRFQVSRNDAVAMRVGSTRVGFYRTQDPPLRIDGQPTPLKNSSLSLPDGGTVFNVDNDYWILWPTGEQVLLVDDAYLDVYIRMPRVYQGQITGLGGTFNGDPSDDLRTRNGTPILPPVLFDTLYGFFGNSWRITQAESLFDYDPGENTTTFTDLNFPAIPSTACSLPSPVRTAAAAICEAAGVPESLLKACTLDVAALDDVNAAQTYANRGFSQITTEPSQTISTEGEFFCYDERGFLGPILAAGDGVIATVISFDPYEGSLFNVSLTGEAQLLTTLPQTIFDITDISRFGEDLYLSARGEDEEDNPVHPVFRVKPDGEVSTVIDDLTDSITGIAVREDNVFVAMPSIFLNNYNDFLGEFISVSGTNAIVAVAPTQTDLGPSPLGGIHVIAELEAPEGGGEIRDLVATDRGFYTAINNLLYWVAVDPFSLTASEIRLVTSFSETIGTLTLDRDGEHLLVTTNRETYRVHPTDGRVERLNISSFGVGSLVPLCDEYVGLQRIGPGNSVAEGEKSTSLLTSSCGSSGFDSSRLLRIIP